MTDFNFSGSFPDWIQPFKQSVLSNKKLNELGSQDKIDFVYLVLEKMAKQVGGMGYFWRKEEEDFVIEGWLEALGSLKIEQILRTVSLVLDCQYNKREDYVPRTAMDFKHFWKARGMNADCLLKQESQKPVALLVYDEEGSKKRAEEARKQIRALTSKLRRASNG
jgi:hypothetical protein